MVFIALFLNRKTENVKKIHTNAFDFRQLRPIVKYWKSCVSWKLRRIVARTFEHKPFISITSRSLAIEVQSRKITTFVTREPMG